MPNADLIQTKLFFFASFHVFSLRQGAFLDRNRKTLNFNRTQDIFVNVQSNWKWWLKTYSAHISAIDVVLMYFEDYHLTVMKIFFCFEVETFHCNVLKKLNIKKHTHRIKVRSSCRTVMLTWRVLRRVQ